MQISHKDRLLESGVEECEEKMKLRSVKEGQIQIKQQ